MAAGTVGKVVQVLGAVVDCEFPPDQLPTIFSALEIRRDPATTAGSGDGRAAGGDGSNGTAGAGGGQPERLVLEVEQHIGNNWVRCVAMDTTDGLRRGVDVVDTGGPISVPVGPGTLGRLMNVTGDPVDEQGPITHEKRYP